MAAGVDFGALQKIAARVQDVVVDPGAWVSVLDDITMAAGANVSSLMRKPMASPDVSVIAVNQEAEPFLKHYMDGGWHKADLRTRAIPKLLRTGIGVDQDFTTTDEIARHPYYQEFLGPFGLRWWAGMGFRSGDDVWCLAVQRRTEKGYFDLDEQAMLASMCACLSDAAVISKAVGQAQLATMTDALDLVAQPALVMGRDGQILRENAAAERVFDSSFYVAGRRLIVRDRQAAADLAALVGEARCSTDKFLASRQIVVQRGDRRPVVIDMHGLSGAAAEPFAGGRALLLLTDLDERPRLGRDRAARVFGLTPAEAALAVVVGRGDSLDEACDELSIARETARSRLKQIFAKTGVNRQGELVALLARMGDRAERDRTP